MDDSWSSDGENINSPSFRPFTREELEVVEKKIFEKKLAAKKLEEKLAKNIRVSRQLMATWLYLYAGIAAAGAIAMGMKEQCKLG